MPLKNSMNRISKTNVAIGASGYPRVGFSSSSSSKSVATVFGYSPHGKRLRGSANIMSKPKAKKDKFVLNVTEKDYEKEIASGMTREDAMRPGKHIFRRVDPKRVAKPEDLQSRNIKLIVTM